MQEDLPAPVAPATKMCGIFARLAQITAPSTSLPKPTTNGCLSSVATGELNKSDKATNSRS